MPVQGRAAVARQCQPVRVFTLGRFRVEVGDAPLRSGRKAQRRPIDLLKLLIARGGEAVSAEQLAEDLWPDSEGDAALAALRTTVSRLRRLIGHSAILRDNGALTLNPEVCWVDALALAQRLVACRHASQGDCSAESHASFEEALSLYRGDFMPGECSAPAVQSARARLRSLALRHVADLGRCYVQARQFDRAMDVYCKGLEIDGAAEEMARKAIECCSRCGRSAEGIAVYRGCQEALKSRLGVEPSPATRAAYDELLRDRARESEAQSRAAAPPPRPVFPTGPDALSIAILPFEDLSPRGDFGRLAIAVRETLISLLGALPQISIISQPPLAPGPGRIAGSGLLRQFDAARYLLRGSVVVVDDRLRAGAQLIDAKTGQHAWSEQFEYGLGDLIEAQDQVAIKVAGGLATKMIFRESTAMLLSPRIQTWKALAHARTCLHQQRRQDYLQARALLTRLGEEQGDEPAVSAVTAGLRVAEGRWWLSPEPLRSLLSSEQICRNLQACYAGDAPSLPTWGWACALRGEFEEALRHSRREVERTPDNFVTHAFLGLSLNYLARCAEALTKITDAFETCPRPPHWLYKDRAVAQFCLGRYDDAASGLATALVDEYPMHRESNLLNARMMYVASLAASGRAEQARHEAAVIRRENPTVTAGGWCGLHFHPYRVNSPAKQVERLLVESGLPL